MLLSVCYASDGCSTVGKIFEEQVRTAEKQCLRNSDGSLCSWCSPALASRLLDTADLLVTGANLISQFLSSLATRHCISTLGSLISASFFSAVKSPLLFLFIIAVLFYLSSFDDPRVRPRSPGGRPQVSENGYCLLDLSRFF